MKKSLISLAVVGILALLISAQQSKADNVSTYTPNVADVQKAGFTQVEVTPVSGNRYVTPPYYFTVREHVTQSSEAPNIVMVSIYKSPTVFSNTGALYTYGTDSKPFTLPSAQGREATLGDGRTVVNFIMGNNYAVIIGPDKTKVENLATIVQEKLK